MNSRFKCSLCSSSRSDINALLRHLKDNHPGRFRLTCGIDGCQRQYTGIRCYKRHIKACHKNVMSRVSANDNIEEENEINESDQEKEHEESQDDHSYRKLIGMVLLTAREEHKMTTSSTHYISAEFEKILSYEREKLKNSIVNFLRSDLTYSEKCEVEKLLTNTSLLSAFATFSVEKSLDRFAQSQKSYVHPIEIQLGSKRLGKIDTFQYIPILDTLKTFLMHDDVLEDVLNSKEGENVIETVRDGSHVKNDEFLTSKKCLLINLYNDEFTITNPIGNKTKEYKILAFFFTLGNLSPKLNSKIKSIQLILVAKSTHAKEYGSSPILAPLIHDLKVLESVGIHFQFKDKLHTFVGSIAMVISDNLAAHWLAGFQESFSTTKRLCRFCMCLRTAMECCTNSKNCVMRTVETYNTQLKAISACPDLSKEYGLKRDCPLNKLAHFHAAKGFPFDVAHDFFEGICPQVLTLLLIRFIEDGYLTFEIINERIEYFSYARADRKDKPHPFSVKSKSTFKVKLDAVEMWTFCRLFPLLFGELIPKDNKYWSLLYNLLDVMDLVTSFTFDKGLADFMDLRFEELLTLFISLFPGEMKPKFHFGIHYGEQTLMYGPPRTRFTLRFESKNLSLKEPLTQSKNRINVCKSIALRHQNRMVLWNNEQLYFGNAGNKYIMQKLVHIRLLPTHLQELVPSTAIPSNELILVAEGVQTVSADYYTDDVVALRFEEDDYVFGKIENILHIYDKPYLFCSTLEVLEFSSHFHAYLVDTLDVYTLVRIQDLLDYHPLGQYKVGGDLYVPLKHHIYIS